MVTLELTSVSMTVDWQDVERYSLHFVRGRDEAEVVVERDPDGNVESEVEELWADSVLDEIVLGEAAEYWVRNHADALGAIDFDDVVVDSALDIQ